jgi:hypothetical protein
MRYGIRLAAFAIVSILACAPIATAADTTAPAAAAPGNPLPAALPTLTGGVTSSSYADLQQAWDSCFEIKNVCQDLMDEGRFAPARPKWVTYDAQQIANSLATLKNAYAATNLSGEAAAAAAPNWTAAGTAIASIETNLGKLNDVAAAMKQPTDDTYPAKFWGPTRDIMNNATDLDKALVNVLGALEETGAQPAAVTNTKLKGGISVVGKTDVDSLMTATKKVLDNIQHMSVELNRFNLGFGPPPTQPLQNEFYQGAFTKQEILSQYKYMPTFVFTTDPSVARFTYRLPPRQNVLAHYANQVGRLLNMMDTDMLALRDAVNSANDPSLNAPWQELELKYIDARTQYLALYNLLQNTNDKKLAEDIRGDQATYGKPMIALRDDITQFQRAMNDFVAISEKRMVSTQ